MLNLLLIFYVPFQEHLPSEYEYNVLLFNKIDENKFQFRVKFEVKELDEVTSFLESYKVKNCIRFRLAKVNPLDKGTLYHVSICDGFFNKNLK